MCVSTNSYVEQYQSCFISLKNHFFCSQIQNCTTRQPSYAQISLHRPLNLIRCLRNHIKSRPIALSNVRTHLYHRNHRNHHSLHKILLKVGMLFWWFIMEKISTSIVQRVYTRLAASRCSVGHRVEIFSSSSA